MKWLDLTTSMQNMFDNEIPRRARKRADVMLGKGHNHTQTQVLKLKVKESGHQVASNFWWRAGEQGSDSDDSSY